MKKWSFILIFLFIKSMSYSQQYVQMYYNPELYAQITANHGVRIASEFAYQDSYEKQTDNMEYARDKMIQVLVMKQMIYDQLKNVNSALRQGKQLERLFYAIGDLNKNVQEMSTLMFKYPQYSIWRTKILTKIVEHGIAASNEIQEHILKEDTDYLMDSYDRQYLINTLYKRTKAMNGLVLHFNRIMRTARKKPLWGQIPILNNWYNQDKAIIKRIITNYGYVTNP